MTSTPGSRPPRRRRATPASGGEGPKTHRHTRAWLHGPPCAKQEPPDCPALDALAQLIADRNGPWKSDACADRLSDAILALVNQKVQAGETAPVAKKKSPARTPRRA